jgi:hypothetical protein
MERRYPPRMSKNYSSLERQYWLQTKARGKGRFIWREVLFSLLICLVVVVGVPALAGQSRSFSVAILTVAVMLPICLLGGYLTGRWKWKELEKKYPDNSLPPWE